MVVTRGFKRKVAGLVLTVLVTVFGWSGSAAAQSVFTMLPDRQNIATTSESHPCLQYTNHEYEVCTAYIANASLAALVPYYKYARSTNVATARYVTYRLGSRYQGSAYQLVSQRVAGWPSGRTNVSLPDIDIVAVSSDLATNTATLKTRESWQVTDPAGNVLYQEHNQTHTVTTARVPSYLLHKWVVTGIR